MKAEGGGGLPATVLLLAKAGALGCHFKAFPAINQRRSGPPARAPLPAAPASLLKSQTTEQGFSHLRPHACNRLRCSSPAGLPDGHFTGGGGERKQAHHASIVQELLYLGGGRGAVPWLRLHTAGAALPVRVGWGVGFFTSPPAWCVDSQAGTCH